MGDSLRIFLFLATKLTKLNHDWQDSIYGISSVFGISPTKNSLFLIHCFGIVQFVYKSY